MTDRGRTYRPRVPRAALAGAIAALAPVLFAGAACASVESSDAHYVRGRELMRAGHYREAADAFEKAVAEYPGHAEAHYQLGVVYSRRIVDYGKAEREFVALPDLAMKGGVRPRDDLIFRAGVGLGKLYVKSGRNDLAIQIVRSVLSAAPPAAPLDEAFNTLGLAYYYERQYEDAIFELRRAIKLNPGNTNARFNLKTIRTRLEHFNAGKAASRAGARNVAIAEYRLAIALDPRFIEARHRLGAELHAAGEHAEALKELRRAESISRAYRKVHEIRFTEGQVLAALGRDDEALRSFSRVVEARPGFAAAHNEIGLIHLRRREASPAINAFVRAIGIEPRTEFVKNLQAAFKLQGAGAAVPADR
ncbi:MAG: tetratricopeptide repeat protein [Gemmatimonadota bacterium]